MIANASEQPAIFNLCCKRPGSNLHRHPFPNSLSWATVSKAKLRRVVSFCVYASVSEQDQIEEVLCEMCGILGQRASGDAIWKTDFSMRCIVFLF